MKMIELTQNKVALVDDCDYDWLSQWKWCAMKVEHKTYETTWYAVRSVYLGRGSYRSVTMHRLIMLLPPKPLEVDHEDHNSLNNQRANLRIAKHRQNMANRRSSQRADRLLPRGVSARPDVWELPPAYRRFKAQITVGGRPIYLGTFNTPEEALNIFQEAHRHYFGEFSLFAV